MKNWNPNFAYIVFSVESGPSDQTDIDWTIIVDPLGRWSVIPELDSDWATQVGGRPQD